MKKSVSFLGNKCKKCYFYKYITEGESFLYGKHGGSMQPLISFYLLKPITFPFWEPKEVVVNLICLALEDVVSQRQIWVCAHTPPPFVKTVAGRNGALEVLDVFS